MARLCSRLANSNNNQSRSTPRNASNPYSTFKFLCVNVRTKEHAQLVGIVSLSVFVCLIVVSYSIFGAFAVAYIACGIIIYGFLMESLLRRPNKLAILGYVTFEALQIAFYLSLAIYIIIPLIYAKESDFDCPTPTQSPDDKPPRKEDCGNPKVALAEILIFLIFLILMKGYFTRVMLYLYKYFVWMDQHSGDLYASYINNRGVQISVDDNIFPPAWTPGVFPTTGITPLPTYDEATTMQKVPISDASPTQQQQPQENHEPQMANTPPNEPPSQTENRSIP